MSLIVLHCIASHRTGASYSTAGAEVQLYRTALSLSCRRGTATGVLAQGSAIHVLVLRISIACVQLRHSSQSCQHPTPSASICNTARTYATKYTRRSRCTALSSFTLWSVSLYVKLDRHHVHRTVPCCQQQTHSADPYHIAKPTGTGSSVILPLVEPSCITMLIAL